MATDDAASGLPIPEVSDSYQRTRTQYGLFSGLLLAWELIGFEVPEAPLENISIKLKSPQAIPYVFAALISYFAFRMFIEWFQLDVRRRLLKPSKVDFFVSHGLAALSLFIYGIQAALRFQIADRISPLIILALPFAALAGNAAVRIAGGLRKNAKRLQDLLEAGVLLVLSTVLVVSLAKFDPGVILISSAVAFILGAFMGFKGIIVVP